MKRIISLSLICFTAILIFSSCDKKENDNPTAKEKLTGTWNIQEVKVNDEVMPIGDIGLKFEFKSDGTGFVRINLSVEIPLPMTWDIVNSDQTLKVNISGSELLPAEIMQLIPSEVQIITLTTTDFHCKSNPTNETDPVVELKMVKA